VAYTVILATWEMEVGMIKVWGQPGQKVNKTKSHPVKLGMVVSFQLQRKRISVQAVLGKNLRHYLKNN
jgi:hypothetical protein